MADDTLWGRIRRLNDAKHALLESFDFHASQKGHEYWKSVIDNIDLQIAEMEGELYAYDI